MKKLIVTASMVLTTLLLGIVVGKSNIAYATPKDDVGHKVRICHRSNSVTNPYENNTVDYSSVDGGLVHDNGNGDHTNHLGPVFDPSNPPPAPHNGDQWGDIIPPYSWTGDATHAGGSYPGMNWNSQGQAFWNNACSLLVSTPTPTPTPTVTPSPTPTPTPTPTVTPTPTPTSTPTPTPTPTVTPSPTPNPCDNEDVQCSTPVPTPTPTVTPNPTATPVPGPGQESSSAIDPGSVCPGSNFDASMTLKRDGQPVKGVTVKFVYHNEAKFAKTETNGRAGVQFGYVDESNVEYLPEEGFPSQLQKVTRSTSTDCKPVVNNTNGKVLGASTMAKTGVVEETLTDMIGLMGAAMTAAGSFLYAKKRV